MIAWFSSAHCLLVALILACCLSEPVEANLFSRLTSLGKDDRQERDIDYIGSERERIPHASLANGVSIPMVGLGVGNLPQDIVSDLVAEAIQHDKQTYLIETAHISDNEHLVAEGILKGLERLSSSDGKLQVHVITKIWYTYLGYERTRLAVNEIINAFKPVAENKGVELRLHILLHWPRCYDSIPFMDCAADESSLLKHVKEAGPNPTSNPNAYKDSWRMLEDAFLAKDSPIESIGVANFHVSDLQDLTSFARVYPHLLQTSLWSLVHDAHLVNFCHAKGIHLQAFNALQSTVWKSSNAPRAFHHIQKVANELASQTNGIVTPAQVILAWLTQLDVSVVPRTSKMTHLSENAAVAIAKVPHLSDRQVDVVADAVEAYLTGIDLVRDVPISLTFQVTTKDALVYWLGEIDEIRLALVKTGRSFNETSYPGHVYRIYDAQDRDVYVDYMIDASDGFHQTVHVDLVHRSVTRGGSELSRSLELGGQSTDSGAIGLLESIKS